MSIHCSLHHLTSYRYDQPVQLGPQVIRLRPSPHSRIAVPSYSLKITPEKHFLNWQQDPQGNFLARVVFPEPVRYFAVEVDLIADLTTINPFDFFLEEGAEHYPFSYTRELQEDLKPYLATDLDIDLETPLFNQMAASLPIKKGMEVNSFMVAMNNAVHKRVSYTIRHEPGVQEPEETLEKGSGSCRDSAWLLVHLMRRLGIAARFCSGYIIQLKADQKPVNGGPEGPSDDFTDLHAWTEIYLPGAGWVGLDPTSGLLTGEGHIPLCAAAHYENAAPISGNFSAGPDLKTEFGFDMKVARVRETPRVTLPYTAEQAARIEALGHKLDERLLAQDMRLTMGGEPTFVSATEMEGAEWNTDALGPTKELYADQLLHRLYHKFSPGAFLHHGQGKWYPGEPLPRWAFSAYWRTDGVPVWKDPSLFADQKIDYGHGSKESDAFIRLLAKNLGLPDTHVLTAYEDIFYYMWKERRLPVNVGVDDPRLDDKLERETISRVFERGLGSPTGHLLPLARGASPDEWKTGPWFLRGEELFLVPGNHPMGFRLPLDGLPWADEIDHPILEPIDPTIPREPLPAEPPLSGGPNIPHTLHAVTTVDPAATIRAQHPGSRPDSEGDRASAAPDPVAPELYQSATGSPRTGLCVEARDGRLHVFCPPLVRLEHYLELVGAIEKTARTLATPVRIEGYRPPADPRLTSFSITPDPGVVELNVHPSKSWDELVGKTRTLYEEARSIGLGTEKFMQDGRHSGTGGGNHIVVGGETPLDSPFLRRPHLLSSLIAYFNNHPSLSYLFSGLFIGPTSQSPRLDEARHDTLYELETAFAELPTSDLTVEGIPWIADRVLRNHLVDLTGNTHRAEFCLDKLYSPDSNSGRLGLVELRGFEMPPHAEMSLAQQLLIRGLLSLFWDKPYTTRLVRWGSSIHDKWMMPHFVRDDFADVIGDLQDHDLAFETGWFEPHHEFRFPLIGEYDQRNLHLELRQALEPWHVLGEEQSRSGTSRYVDSSIERVQVKVSGLTESRHRITCNGATIPLHPTGRQGEFVAGVRFRAWAPHSALHPTKPVNSPLTFDLVDTWNKRSIGGCQYHVVHPGGRSYDDFPFNAFVAESRRRSRFMALNRTPGEVDPPPPVVDREYPMTLDLQRFSH